MKVEEEFYDDDWGSKSGKKHKYYVFTHVENKYVGGACEHKFRGVTKGTRKGRARQGIEWINNEQ